MISDHAPTLINFHPNSDGGSRPLKFFNYIVDCISFFPLLKECWKKDVGPGTYMFHLWRKLLVVRGSLKLLHKEEFAGVSQRFERARQASNDVQCQLQVISNYDLHNQEKNVSISLGNGWMLRNVLLGKN